MIRLLLISFILSITLITFSGCTDDSDTETGPETVLMKQPPEIKALTFVGTDQADEGGYAIRDSSGNLYIAGSTHGSFEGGITHPESNILVTSLDSNYQEVWHLETGSEASEIVRGITIGDEGFIYITGHTTGQLGDDPHWGGQDIFVMKIDPSGTVVWQKQFGSSGDDAGIDISGGFDGRIYLGAFTNGELVSGSHKGGFDVVVARLTPKGEIEWISQFGSPKNDTISKLEYAENSLYLTGSVEGDLEGNSAIGWQDSFLTKLNLQGDHLWSRQWGTVSTDRGSAISIDINSGDIFVTGNTEGDLTKDGSFMGGSDLFLTRFQSDGTLKWSRQWGTPDNDEAGDIMIEFNDIYITGNTSGDFAETNGGGKDIVMINLDLDGAIQSKKQWGGSANESGITLTKNGEDRIDITGVIDGGLFGSEEIGGGDIFTMQYEK